MAQTIAVKGNFCAKKRKIALSKGESPLPCRTHTIYYLKLVTAAGGATNLPYILLDSLLAAKLNKLHCINYNEYKYNLNSNDIE